MSQTRTGYRLLQGATVSLGPVNLTGKSYDDYKVSEIAFIIGRYMIHNSDDNKVYIGAVSTIAKRLWPDRWNDTTEFTDSKDAKRIYFWLKTFGFSSRRGIQTTWFLPADLDNQYGQKVLLKGGADPKDVPVAPVLIKCKCGAGPFENQDAFNEHAVIHQPAKVETEADEVKEKTLVAATSTDSMTTCPECKAQVSQAGFKSHLYAAHSLSQCPKCGKLISGHGLGGHTQTHKVPRRQKELLSIIRAQGDGHSPGYYSQFISPGKNGSQDVRSLGAGLMKRGFIRGEGHTMGRRYYLTAKGRGKGGATVKATMKPAVAEPTPAMPKPPKAVAEPVKANGVPGGKDATVFETKDGHAILVMNGKSYFITEMSELAAV